MPWLVESSSPPARQKGRWSCTDLGTQTLGIQPIHTHTESLGGVLTGVLSRKMVLSTLGGVLSTPSRAISGLRTLRTRSSALINATDEG